MADQPNGRLLISHITLRGPEIRQLYQVISEQPGIGYGDLKDSCMASASAGDLFGLQEATLREALDFLVTAGMVEQDGSARRKACFRATLDQPCVCFPLLLLHHVGMLADERQQAISLIHRQLVMQDVLATTLTQLRDDAERGPYASLFAWTGEKIGFWGHLAASLGLVRRLEREAELLVVPQLNLLAAALEWATERDLSSSSLSASLQAIDNTFFACFTGTGRVHRGLAQALVALHRRARIQLTHHSDSAQSVLLGEWRVSDVRLPIRENG